MKWLGALVLLAACKAAHTTPPPGGASLVLDIPNGALDPKGFTTAEIVLHEPTGDITRSANVTNNAFDLGSIDPSNSVSVEATLRTETGTAVGYGRTAMATAFTGGAEIVVPVRRPIAYIAGSVSRDIGTGNATVLQWSEVPATFSDLSVGGTPDGKTLLPGPAVSVVGAGPNLYLITQPISATTGDPTAPAKLAPVSMVDHQVGAPLAGAMAGAVLDSAGSDDGTMLVIGTSTELYAVNTATGATRVLADGSFARVAIVMTDTGELDAVAVKNRGSTTAACTPTATAELWWAPLADGGVGHKVATGGFTDVASDRGQAYYLDGCKGELGELTATATRMIRTFAVTGGARPTALAVSNAQAYVGVETPPATTSLLVASLKALADDPRTLWTESAQQVLKASNLAGVQRQLDASSAVFGRLELGAGGDYVALTTSAHFHGNAVTLANFPDMTIDAEELRVFDAATGGIVERYRSWCDGSFIIARANDIDAWECALTPGQTEAADAPYEHHINAMTFLFGKR